MQAFRSNCPVDEIAAYVDGELDATRETELDAHFVSCAACSDELNMQKQFLCSLESSLKSENEIELPADFTKHIVANAESTVSGLRRPRERFNAVFICAALMLFILFALGADARTVLDGFAAVFDKVTAVGSFFGHFVYSFFLGVTIILRTIASQIRPESFAAVIFGIVVITSLAFVSGRMLSARRV